MLECIHQAASFYTGNERLARIVNALGAGIGGESFSDIATYLLAGQGVADPYLCLADFEAYRLSKIWATWVEWEKRLPYLWQA